MLRRLEVRSPAVLGTQEGQMPAQNMNGMALRNARLAKAIWPALGRAALQKLRSLTQETATVYRSRTCRGFVGYADADPSNVSPQVRGAEMRVAETRAVNRALRKAYGIGICSIEELGSFSGPVAPAGQVKKSATKAEPSNGDGNHPLRDRLCLLIRQHRLDPALVKAYAADYCDVPELRQASREQVAGLIKHLAEYAQNDREGLLCQLNGYGQKPATAAAVTIANDSSQPEQKAEGAA